MSKHTKQTITLAQIKAALARHVIDAMCAREDEIARLCDEAYLLVTEADKILNGENES